jgi:hypothetical protein
MVMGTWYTCSSNTVAFTALAKLAAYRLACSALSEKSVGTTMVFILQRWKE